MPGDEGLWARDAQALQHLVTRASVTLARAVAANPAISPQEFVELYRDVVQLYGQAATGLAMNTLDQLAMSWEEGVEVVAAEELDPEVLELSAAWAVRTSDSPQAAVGKAIGSVGRRVRNAHRDTVAATARASGLGYARVPGPKACAFCLMLASRGAVYAADTVGARVEGHPFSEAQRYHDRCDCQARLVRSEKDLPEVNRQLQEEWYAVTGGAPGDVDLGELWRSHVRLTRPNGESGLPEGVDLSKAQGKALKSLADKRAAELERKSAESGGKPPKPPVKPPTGGFSHAGDDGDGEETFGPSPGARPWPEPIDEEGVMFSADAVAHWWPSNATRVAPAAKGLRKVKTKDSAPGRPTLVSVDRFAGRFRTTQEVDADTAVRLAEIDQGSFAEKKKSEVLHEILSEARQRKTILELGAQELIRIKPAGRGRGKSPDDLVDGVMIEYKTPREQSKLAFQRALKECREQAMFGFVDAQDFTNFSDDDFIYHLANFSRDYQGKYGMILVQAPGGKFFYID